MSMRPTSAKAVKPVIGDSGQQARRFKKLLALDGELDKATPKTLLCPILHVRLARGQRNAA
ncbi:hypothetical protein ACFRCW_18105 [Streptomyces sp. NPDC056653]|uniref:hypothetical protein n=1 Tax=Streptomyces sp. NPDC056653 TaxID=3345894 RepID=UPI00368BB182